MRQLQETGMLKLAQTAAVPVGQTDHNTTPNPAGILSPVSHSPAQELEGAGSSSLQGSAVCSPEPGSVLCLQSWARSD